MAKIVSHLFQLEHCRVKYQIGCLTFHKTKEDSVRRILFVVYRDLAIRMCTSYARFLTQTQNLRFANYFLPMQRTNIHRYLVSL